MKIIDSSDVTMPSQIKPTRSIYVFDNLEGHSLVSQIFILNLNIDKDVSSMLSTFQILALKIVIVSVLCLTEFTLLLLRVSVFRKLYVKLLNLEAKLFVSH